MRIPIRRTHLLGIVLSLSLLGCAGDEPRISAEFNQNASLVGALPANPLQWRVISSSIDPANSTMSTLYGNDAAVAFARSHAQHDYPAGSVLSLVTWSQTEDVRWFGAKIPENIKSVEFVTVESATDGTRSYSYQEFAGSPLKMRSTQQSLAPSERIASLLSQRAAVMP
jgi:Cytochrome P460